MRIRSRELKEKIRKFAEKFYSENLRAPSMREIAEEFDINKSTAYRYLVDMDREGMLDYKSRERMIGTARISKTQRDLVCVPTVGFIPCGAPEEEEEYIEEYVMLPRAIVGEGEFFLLRASGNSMIEAGINNGSLVLIRRQVTAMPGQIVAALCDGKESTLKRLETKDGRLVLHPENHEMEDIVPERIEIQGVAVYVMNKLE